MISDACVLLKQADMCIAERGAVGCVSCLRTHTHMHAGTLDCGITKEAQFSACKHTHVCCTNKESVVNLPLALILF